MIILKKFRSLLKIIIKKYFKLVVLISLKTEWRTCILCGNSQSFYLLYNRDRFGLPIKTQKCKKCNLIFINPSPTKKFIEKFYSSSMYRGLYKGYLKANNNFIIEDNSLQRAHFHISFLREEFNFSENFSILDFGCSEGTFLKEVINFYPYAKAYGVEPGISFRKFINDYRINIFNSLSEIPNNIKFNFITLWHVLEHLYEPIDTLKKLKKRLNNEGHIVIEVPNVENYKGIKNIHIAHLFHFTPNTISQVCQKSGLIIEKIYKKFDREFSMVVIVKK